MGPFLLIKWLKNLRARIGCVLDNFVFRELQLLPKPLRNDESTFEIELLFAVTAKQGSFLAFASLLSSLCEQLLHVPPKTTLPLYNEGT